MANKLLTIKDVCDKCGLTAQGVYVAIKTGRLKAFLHDRKWMISPDDLKEYRSKRYDRSKSKIGNELVHDPNKGELSPKNLADFMAFRMGKPIPLQHVYHLLRSGQIRSYRKGFAWVVMKDDAIAFLDSKLNENKLEKV